MKPSEYHACATGDCQHDSPEKCREALTELADDLHAELEKDRADAATINAALDKAEPERR